MLKQLRAFLLHPQSLITGFGFLSLSILMSTWATRLPDLKDLLELNNGQIGTGLLVLSIGALVISPFSSNLMDRFSTGKITYFSVILQCLFYILPFFAINYITFLIAMFILGVANGFMTITINGAASGIEKKFNRSIMSSVHGMFSIGAIIGSVSASFVGDIGISPFIHMGGIITFLTVANILLRKIWYSIPDCNLKAPVIAIPTLPVLGFTIITFCIVLAELTIMDWSAVYLKKSLGSSAALMGYGFAGFSVTMAIGRLYGDTVVPILGKRNIVVIGCFIGSLGLSIAAFTSSPVIAIGGFTISGIGMAIIVPMLYSLASNLSTVSSGVGIASIATACVFSGLVGRPLVGWISDYADMSVSIWIASSFALLAGLIGFSLKKERKPIS